MRIMHTRNFNVNISNLCSSHNRNMLKKNMYMYGFMHITLYYVVEKVLYLGCTQERY